MLRDSLFLVFCATAVSAVVTMDFLVPPDLVLTKSGNEFHMAIAGDGFFAVLDEETLRTNYTRAGEWKLNNENSLVLVIQGQEYSLEPPICVPEDYRDLHIGMNGYVSVLRGTEWERVGRIMLIRFENRATLPHPLDVNFVKYVPGNTIAADPGTNGAGSIQQGWIEERKLLSRHRTLGGAIIGLFLLGALVRSRSRGRRGESQH